MHELTQRLIDRTHARTMAGQLDWVEGPGKNAFAFEADGYQVVVEANPSTAMIRVMDTEGRELETLDEEALAAVRNLTGKDYETVVREIHQHARRVALGTDEAIERILRTMGD